VTKTRIKNVGVQYRCDKHDPHNKWFRLDALMNGGNPVRSCHKCSVPGCKSTATRWSGEAVYQVDRKDRGSGEKRGPKRNILWVVRSWEVSRLGNPRYYFVFLDCGHTQMRYHGPHTVMTYFAWTLAESGTSATFPQARCEDCKNERAPDYYDTCVYSHLPL
jgi:hypothetical protein